MSIGVLDSSNLSTGQKVAVKYFTVAIVLFLAQIIFGLLAGLQFIVPEFLYNVLDFNVNRMVHINAMVVWMLYGFIGSVYWLVEDEAGVELVGAKLANINFYVLTTAVAIVVVGAVVYRAQPRWERWAIIRRFPVHPRSRAERTYAASIRGCVPSPRAAIRRTWSWPTPARSGSQVRSPSRSGRWNWPMSCVAS